MKSILATITVALAEWAFGKVYRFIRDQHKRVQDKAKARAERKAATQKQNEAQTDEDFDNATRDRAGY